MIKLTEANKPLISKTDFCYTQIGECFRLLEDGDVYIKTAMSNQSPNCFNLSQKNTKTLQGVETIIQVDAELLFKNKEQK